jgi:hypothetical protein
MVVMLSCTRIRSHIVWCENFRDKVERRNERSLVL